MEETQQETPSLSLSPKLGTETSSNQAILPSWGLGKTQSETPGLSLSFGNAADSAENPVQTTISYTYDSLYRLTDAVYSNGFEFHYTYDAVGNRLTQTTCAPNVPCGTTTYGYDAANRLTSVNGVACTWDSNGNLLNDGTSTYAYDSRNRLTTLTQGGHSYAFAYNGNGDRLIQSVDGAVTRYTLDLEAGLTQVLSDGSYAYLYGGERLAQVSTSEADYFLGDALGSLRQLVDANGGVTLAKSYEPYGSVMSSSGSGSSTYAFDGEQQQGGLTFLRARYLDNATGTFVSRDSWNGNDRQPASYSAWLYVYADPVNHKDPSGQCLQWLPGGFVENHRPPEAQPCSLYEWSPTESLSTPTCDTAFSTWTLVPPATAPNYTACESQDWQGGIITYNRDYAVQYANRYPEGTYNPTYGVFLRGTGADCTNFVSQILHAGGLPMTKQWYYDRPTSIETIGDLAAGHCAEEGAWGAGGLFPICASSWPYPPKLEEVLTKDYGFQVGTIMLDIA